ncbi:MAG: serine hydroxymethyltransferase [Alphaproteobacteria bacterium]|nr:serine hydroxymethyltransferase [Rickettsiales bacterium]
MDQQNNKNSTTYKEYINKIANTDDELFGQIKNELSRQKKYIQMIASENATWPEVMLAQGSVLTNKYAEGYPEKRYYNGCGNVDQIEKIAMDRLRKLFKCEYVNVQPHSGTNANMAVLTAFLQPHDTLLGMSLDFGGHLTHGSKVSISGKFFNAQQYKARLSDHCLDYDAILQQAREVKPKLIIAGCSAYPKLINWKRFREIADDVGAILHCDIAHIAGLIAGGVIDSPMEFADVVTATTHKTLKGPRGGIIMAKNMTYAKKLNSAVFPATQGGPLMHVIAAKAVAFKKASTQEFKNYTAQIIKNAKAIEKAFKDNNIKMIGGGTECHLILVDLSDKKISGAKACKLLEQAGIVANKNAIPFDKLGVTETSGIRFGSPYITSMGMGEKEAYELGVYISEIINIASDIENLQNKQEIQEVKLQNIIKKIKVKTLELCHKFPIYNEDVLL